jgi:hypothetical protein
MGRAGAGHKQLEQIEQRESRVSLLLVDERPADPSRTMSCISRTVTSLFTCESQGKQQEAHLFEYTLRNWHRKISSVSSTDP